MPGGPIEPSPSHHSDASLATAFRRGDDAAFAALYARYVRPIHDYVRGIVRNSATAEDVTQAVFLRAFEQRSSLKDPEAVRAWFFRIAHNAAVNQVTRARSVDVLDSETSIPAVDWGPEDQVVQAEAVELVWDAAASLEPRQFAVLDLSLRKGLSSKEIGVVLGLEAGQAAVVANRAREALGNAVRYLIVARRRQDCDRLAELVPMGVRRLTPDQRASVDRHMRRCPVCQRTASALTAPDRLFGSVALALVPARLAGWTPPRLAAAPVVPRGRAPHHLRSRVARLPHRSIILSVSGALVTAAVVGAIRLWPSTSSPQDGAIPVVPVHPTTAVTPTGTRALPEATHVLKFQPFSLTGPIVTETRGRCDSGSQDDPGRAAAFRCVSNDGSVGNGTPCFADLSAGDPGSPLLCSDDPTSDRIVRLVQEPGSSLPISLINPDDETKPAWFLVLADGRRCALDGYGTDRAVLPYDCGGGLAASMPDRAHPWWTVREAPFGTARPPSGSSVAVVSAFS